MDDAFIPASEVIRQIVSIDGELVDLEQGVRSRIHQFKIDMPVELSLSRDMNGRLRIGSAPPLYYVDTTFRPSYHLISVTAVLAEQPDGE